MSKEDRPKKLFYKKWWFIAIFLVIIIGAGGCTVDNSKDETENNETGQTETEDNEQEETETEDNVTGQTEIEDNEQEEAYGSTDTYYQSLSQEEKNIYDKVADVSGKEKIITVAIIEESETYQFIYIQLQFKSDNKSDNNTIKSYILNEDIDMIKELSEMSEVNELNAIQIDNFIPIMYKDMDVEEVNRPVITMRLERETIDKINWDSFSGDDFEDTGDHYREDPIFNQ